MTPVLTSAIVCSLLFSLFYGLLVGSQFEIGTRKLLTAAGAVFGFIVGAVGATAWHFVAKYW
jgi:uncharacterized protein (DUF697 family)